jgi:paraquat-inducible protein A
MTSSDKHSVPDAPEGTMRKQPLTACPGCDLMAVIPPLPDDHYLVCKRCGKTIATSPPDSINRVFILSLTGLLVYLPAMFLPLMTLSSIGLKEKGNVIDSFIKFFTSGYYLVALIVLLTAIIFPFLKLFLPFSITLCLKLNKRPAWLKPGFKLLKHLEEWGMVEVYLLGILVTLIKMSGMASISYNAGFFSFVLLVLISIAASVNLDESLYWFEIDRHNSQLSSEKFDRIKADLTYDPDLRLTAAQTGLMRCHDCGLLVDGNSAAHDPSTCPRCNSPIHLRNSDSLVKTWALVVTAIILFIPANTVPIMRVDFLGVPERSTIMDGIIYFFKEGSFGIGLIILIASVLVPLFKMIGMIIILITIKLGRKRHLKQKAKMFRFIEFIGRWSMLDIFVVALLTVLVNFGFLTSIHSAPGATYFAMVVVTTMIAALVFDPRIMWDRCDPTGPQTTDQRG